MAKIKVNFWLDLDEWEAIGGAAGDARLTKSEWMRGVLRKALAPKCPPQPELREPCQSPRNSAAHCTSL